MSVELDVQYAVTDDDSEPPSPALIKSWVEAALLGRREDAELTVRIVNVEEMQQLNRTYRQQDKPTNVLSFPFDQSHGIELPLLGDVVICAAVVAQEAQQQHKSLHDHWAHMVVHGVLHLLGYDHTEQREAELMEGLEVEILQRFGIPNPYETDCSQAAIH
jgi:probable rRNA maturation factor